MPFGHFPSLHQVAAAGSACQHLGKRADVSANVHRRKLAVAVTRPFSVGSKKNSLGIGSALNAAGEPCFSNGGGVGDDEAHSGGDQPLSEGG
jgi:hypothetical protein